MNSISGSAPGRLDLLGGVADYSGALVLEVPTRLTTTVVAEPADALVVGPVHALRRRDRDAGATPVSRDARHARPASRSGPTTCVGVAVVLVRHGVIEPPQARLRCRPTSRSRSACRRAPRSRSRPHGRSAPTRSTRSASRRCARRRRTTSSVRRAGSWTRSRWPWATPGAILRSSADPRRCGRVASTARRYRGGRMADRRRARRRRRALPPGPRRGVHGQADRRGREVGRTWSWVSELPVERGRRAARGARRRDVPRPVGRRPTTTSPPSSPRDVSGRGGDDDSASRSTGGARPHSWRWRGDARRARPAPGGESRRATTRWGSATPWPRRPSRRARTRGRARCPFERRRFRRTVVVVCDRGALDDLDDLIR